MGFREEEKKFPEKGFSPSRVTTFVGHKAKTFENTDV